jgi:GT2 family glycosyltransferase
MPSHVPYEVIVVDNASSDETPRGLATLQREWPELRVERLSINTGFSPACNRGAEVARGKLLVFLNNDTEVQPGWLPPLLAELEKPGVGIVGPKLLYPCGTRINHGGYVFGNGIFYGIYQERAADLPAANKPRGYQALLGACVVLSKELFESVGGFSLDGLEDIDLCLKIKERGLEVRYVPSSVVYHHGSVTLRLSPPGSFPITSNRGFASRWGAHKLVWDDHVWHLTDGEWTAPPGAVSFEESLRLATESMALAIKADQAREGGDSLHAEAYLLRALELWPCNPWAFIRLAHHLFESGRTVEVLFLLARLGEFRSVPNFVKDLEPVIRGILPPESCAAIFSDKPGE